MLVHPETSLMRKSPQTLSLNRETLVNLDRANLELIGGAAFTAVTCSAKMLCPTQIGSCGHICP